MKTSEAILAIIKQEGGRIDAVAFQGWLKQLGDGGYIKVEVSPKGLELVLTDKALHYMTERGITL